MNCLVSLVGPLQRAVAVAWENWCNFPHHSIFNPGLHIFQSDDCVDGAGSLDMITWGEFPLMTVGDFSVFQQKLESALDFSMYTHANVEESGMGLS